MLIFAVPKIYTGAAGQGVGAQYITDLIDEKDLITVDIGGTSTDISLVPAAPSAGSTAAAS